MGSEMCIRDSLESVHLASHSAPCTSSSSSSSSTNTNTNTNTTAVTTTIIDTHCHLDILFERRRFTGGLMSHFVAQPEFAWPSSVRGCITMFCDPAALSPSFSLYDMLLSEKNVWGAFGLVCEGRDDLDCCYTVFLIAPP